MDDCWLTARAALAVLPIMLMWFVVMMVVVGTVLVFRIMMVMVVGVPAVLGIGNRHHEVARESAECTLQQKCNKNDDG